MNTLENTKIHVKTKSDAQILSSVADVMGFVHTHKIKPHRFIIFHKNSIIEWAPTTPKGVRYFENHKHKKITFKNLTPPKNADLMTLQAMGVLFRFGLSDNPKVHCLDDDRKNYTIHLPLVFEEVPIANPNAEKIEHIENEMRRLADELKKLKE